MRNSSEVDLQKIIDLTSAKPQANGYLGKCLCHEDSKPSYSFDVVCGTFVHTCFAGCDRYEMWKKLVEVGAAATKQERRTSHEYSIEASVPLNSGLAEVGIKYLRNRGLDLPTYHSSLRFIADCAYYEDKILLSKNPTLVGLVQRDGFIVGIHKIYLTQDAKKADLQFPKKSVGPVAGGYVLLGKMGERVAVTEGIETGLAVHLATELPVLAALTATGMKKLTIPCEVRQLEIFADKDLSCTGQEAAEVLKARAAEAGLRAQIHLPALDIPESAKGIDWLDVRQLEGDTRLIAALGATAQDPLTEVQLPILKKQNEPVVWPEPIPLDEDKFPAPILEKGSMPGIIENYVFSEAASRRVVSDFILAPVLVSLGAICGRTFSMFPSPESSWQVFSNLWGMICGRPGTRKSSALQAGFVFLEDLEKESVSNAHRVLASNSVEIKKLEIELSNKKKACSKKGADIDSLASEIVDLEEKIKNLQPLPKRYIYNDATVEKVIMMLEQNSNGLLHFRDEMAGFLASLCDAAKSQERGFYLQAWNGSGVYTVDRVTRPGNRVEGICISLLGGTQPGKLDQMLQGAMRGGKEDDGLLQRFQILISDVKHPKLTKDRNKADKEAEKYCSHIFRIANMQSELCPIAFSFSDEAQERFDDWYIGFSNDLQDNPSEWESLDSHFNKYTSLVPKLAMLFHVAESVHEFLGKNLDKFYVNPPIWPAKISIQTLEQSFKVLAFLKAHALRVYSVITKGDELAARSLSKKILEGKIADGDTIRSLKQRHWSNLKHDDDVDLGLNILQKKHWIRIEQTRPSATGRPSSVIRLNPLLAKGVNRK